MRVQVVDSNTGLPVQAEVDDARLSDMRKFVAANPTIIGDGAEWNRTTAKDAQEALAFLVSQLAYTEQEMFEVEYQPMQFEQLLTGGTISYAAGEYARTIDYEIYDHAGQGKKMSPSATDVPEVDVAYARASFPVENGGIGYSYTQEELRITAFLRRPISTVKLQTAIEAYKRHMNTVALFGESESNLTGLINNANVTQENRPSGGAWSAASPGNILSDVNSGLNTVWQNTSHNSIPTVLGVPDTIFTLLQNPLQTTVFTSKTIYQWLKENNLATARGLPFDIVPIFGTNTAGSGATNRCIFFTPGSQNMTMHIPLPLRFLAPQLQGLRVKVPGEYKYSGLTWRRPLTGLYMDGV